jgi:uncharacterized protein (DUF1697 family)
MTHVAFLRAVNVGGRGVVKMTDLQKAFTAAGAKNVATVIASGNVVFGRAGSARHGSRSDSAEGQDAARRRASDCVSNAALSQRLVDAAPFGALVNERTLKLYVLFLAGKPKQLPRFRSPSRKRSSKSLACTSRTR